MQIPVVQSREKFVSPVTVSGLQCNGGGGGVSNIACEGCINISGSLKTKKKPFPKDHSLTWSHCVSVN